MPEKYLKKILTSHVYDVARETTLEFAPLLSARIDNKMWLKREDEQPVFSFKIRGAYNKMAMMSEAVLKKGVIASSAGNHAQGVALAAKRLGCKATIVMPRTTPAIKVRSVKEFAAKVILQGDNYDDAQDYAHQLAAEKNYTFIHPYDDPDVIAGQGTIGLEIVNQFSGDLDAVFVPVGGGGLIAGIALYIKQLRPEVRIIGVEPEEADAMCRSLETGKRIKLDNVGIFADGVAVRQVGKETFSIAQKFIDDMITVSNDEICAAIKDFFEDRRSILEPAGALAIAGAKKYCQKHRWKNKSIIAIASGANVNFDRLRHVAERAEVGERREAILAVTIPEKPGSFKKFCSLVGRHGITEFNYRYADDADAHVFVGLQISEAAQTGKVIANLKRQGYPVLDMTDNEMAKLHIRHLVGGRASGAENEILFRFQFPERPGALMNFLNKMGNRWNISLFHYRNHGADFGRVLAGIQVPAADKKEFKEFLAQLGYVYQEETDNPAYRLFLS